VADPVVKSLYNVDLSAHLAECELNFVRLCRLLARMDAGDSREFTWGEGMEVRMLVTERAPYTSMLDIRQSHRSLTQLDSRMTVRVYHDAGVAEVASFDGCYRVQAKNDYPNQKMHQRDEKQQWNRFLGEWLQHCLTQGRSLSKTEELIAP
jgi:uncharacterized protein YqiB (DUF1249 family)